MYDYDVEAIALSVPPTSAVVTSYRPAVSVRNNGVHEALAVGYLRIYAADLLIFETEIYSATLSPGATGLAQAVNYWTPPAVGKYMIFGTVTCPLDQYEPNDHFGPVTIDVTGLPPPTPPPVTVHAAQHEEGGLDELSVDGLKGLTADLQVPRPHAAGHQAGGPDQINVGGLIGELAQDQPTKTHSNTKHDPPMATQSALTSHQNAVNVHTASTNLEHVANKDIANGYPGLDVTSRILAPQMGQVPITPNPQHGLRYNREWGDVKHAGIGYNQPGKTLLPATGRQNLLALPVPLAWMSDDMQFLYEFSGLLTSLVAPGALLTFSVWFGTEVLSAVTLDLSLLRNILMQVRGSILGIATGKVEANIAAVCQIQEATPTPLTLIDAGGLLASRPAEAASIFVDAKLDNAIPGESLAIYSGYIRALHPIP